MSMEHIGFYVDGLLNRGNLHFRVVWRLSEWNPVEPQEDLNFIALERFGMSQDWLKNHRPKAERQLRLKEVSISFHFLSQTFKHKNTTAEWNLFVPITNLRNFLSANSTDSIFEVFFLCETIIGWQLDEAINAFVE